MRRRISGSDSYMSSLSVEVLVDQPNVDLSCVIMSVPRKQSMRNLDRQPCRLTDGKIRIGRKALQVQPNTLDKRVVLKSVGVEEGSHT